ncbi:MAG: phosphonopyruvate decarboxylase [Kordiimonadaceae bacterium]|nr:phosphonopyruvate decarboxylase [Kordiimonadaceae bacterium]MBO6567436.1 phosphonopyruvate decarboxylase [Kordiimonadaceae bacterium]MBO6963350.1 phosphonopyruvate decarboxylase [Kordiimonadaceae bacterium]
MLNASDFLDALVTNDFSFSSGVPCSFLKGPMQLLANNGSYVAASIEGEAAAIAAGAWLAGKHSAVFSQNSGLGNLVNPLTSLNQPFKIPTLLVVGWRAAPGVEDEPQHRLMGSITKEMLELMEVEVVELSASEPVMRQQVKEAATEVKTHRKSVALLVRPDCFRDDPEQLTRPLLPPRPRGILHSLMGNEEKPSRHQALEAFQDIVSSDAAVIATTGKCGRELFTLNDRDQNFYMVGSMGSASAIGLGIACAQPSRPVFVLDGDGAALMRLGTMSTIGQQSPKNLVHIILDNGAHDSTGGQSTGSESIDFPNVALACGYAAAWQCGAISCFDKALKQASSTEGPTLVHLTIRPGSIKNLGRPTVLPHEVADRFRQFLLKA